MKWDWNDTRRVPEGGRRRRRRLYKLRLEMVRKRTEMFLKAGNWRKLEMFQVEWKWRIMKRM